MGTGLVVSGSAEAIQSYPEQGWLKEIPQMVAKIRRRRAAQKFHAQVVYKIYNLQKRNTVLVLSRSKTLINEIYRISDLMNYTVKE